MAYLPSYFADDEKEKQTTAAAGGQRPRTGAPVATAAPAAATPSAASAPAQGGPSGFINWAQYVGANKDAAKRTAGQVAGRLGKGAQAAQAGLQGAYGTFAEQMKAGTSLPPVAGMTVTSSPSAARWANAKAAHPAAPLPAYDAAARAGAGYSARSDSGLNPDDAAAAEQAALAAYDAAHAPAGGYQAQTGPTPTYISREDAERAAGQTYTGPEDITSTEGWDKVRQDTEDAQDSINATGRADDSGINALLRDYYGKGGNYSQGQSMFDAALVGGEGRKQFADMRRQYADLSGNLDRVAKDSALQVGGARRASDEAAKTYGRLLGDYDKAEADRKAREAAAAAGGATGAGKKYANRNLYDHPSQGFGGQDMGKFGSTVNDIGKAGYDLNRAINPLEWAMNAANIKSPFDQMAADTYGGGLPNYANQINWGDAGLDNAQGDAVYDSMTQAELDAVGAMAEPARVAWLKARAKELGLS